MQYCVSPRFSLRQAFQVLVNMCMKHGGSAGDINNSTPTQYVVHAPVILFEYVNSHNRRWATRKPPTVFLLVEDFVLTACSIVFESCMRRGRERRARPPLVDHTSFRLSQSQHNSSCFLSRTHLKSQHSLSSSFRQNAKALLAYLPLENSSP